MPKPNPLAQGLNQSRRCCRDRESSAELSSQLSRVVSTRGRVRKSAGGGAFRIRGPEGAADHRG